MKLIIHAGFPKCGSSTIQNFLWKNCNELYKQDAYVSDSNLYFSFEPHFNPQLNPSAVWQYFDKIQKGEIEDLNIRLDTAISMARRLDLSGTIIISSEILIEDRMKKILEVLALKFSHIKIILYIRPQIQTLISSWQQWGHKDNVGLNEYIEQKLRLKEPDYLKSIDIFSSVFGAGCIELRLLNNLADDSGLIKHFCRTIGVSIDDRYQVDSKKKNVGINLNLVDILAKIPELYSNRTDNELKENLVEYVNNLELFLDNRAPNLNSQLQAQVVNKFMNDNRRIVNNYLHDPIDKIKYEELTNTLMTSSQSELDRANEMILLQWDILINLTKKVDRIESELFERRSNRSSVYRRILSKLGIYIKRFLK